MFISIIGSSCAYEELVDIGGRPGGTYVVFSAITPADSVFVFVERSIPLNQWENRDSVQTGDKLTVIIRNKNTGDSVLLVPVSGKTPSIGKNQMYGASQAVFKIEPGSTYTLNIKTPDGPSLYAECTVPNVFPVWTDLKVVDTLFEDGSIYYKVRGSWEGSENEEYGFWVLKEMTVILPSEGYVYTHSFAAHDYEIQKINNGYLFEGEFWDPISAQISLMTLSLDLYQFNQTSFPFIDLEFLEKNDIVNSFKGIYPYHSNVQGGAGVFGGYVLSDKREIIF